jgi:acyl-CoA thioesterase-1
MEQGTLTRGLLLAMTRYRFGRPPALVFAVAIAAAVGLALTPAWVLEAAAAPADPSAAAAAPADSRPACKVIPSLDRLDYPLVRVSRHLEEDRSIKIVAIGSSSTAGAGASSPEASYPSRLEAELTRHFQWNDITILNRGANGEEARDMLARFDTSVVAEKPDLVIWQMGTNSVLRDRPFDPKATALHEGLARLKATHTDVILLDPQYAPKFIAKPDAEEVVAQIAATAKERSIDVFHRFGLMRRWHLTEHMPFDAFVSPDGVHMNNWSYDCLAKWLGAAIVEAATRPTTTASRPLH